MFMDMYVNVCVSANVSMSKYMYVFIFCVFGKQIFFTTNIKNKRHFVSINFID